MSFYFLTYFLKANLLLTLSFALITLCACVFRFKLLKVPSFYQLQLGYALILVSLVGPLLFTGESAYDKAVTSAISPLGGMKSIPLPAIVRTINSQNVFTLEQLTLLQAVFMALTFLGVVLFTLDILKLIYSLKNTYILKTIGRVSIRLSARESVPSSFSLGRSAYVVLPQSLVSERETLGHALKHELQHIRQMDTLWIYVLVFIEKTCLINPLVRLFVNHLKSLQEMACDEELIVNKKVVAQAYAQTLLKMLEFKKNGAEMRLAPSILGKTKHNELIRRISAMTHITTKSKLRNTFIMFFTTLTTVLVGASYCKALNVAAKSDNAILYALKIIENGKTISSPSIVVLEGEEALIEQGDKSGKTRYIKIRGVFDKNNNEVSINSNLEYGHVNHISSQEEGEEPQSDFQPLTTAKIATLVMEKPDTATLKFEDVEIDLTAKRYDMKKLRK